MEIKPLTAQIDVVVDNEPLYAKISELQDDLDSVNGEIVNNKTQYLLETKDAIKQSISNKGVSVDNSTTFREYATKIEQIQQERKITDKNTLLLLRFDEEPAKDISPFEHSLQTVGNPILTTDKTLFGQKTLYLDGTRGFVLNDINFQPFMGNFTIEFWWYPVDYSDGATIYSARARRTITIF